LNTLRVTPDKALVEAVDLAARKLGKSRSAFIERLGT
jgi:hypothetical protein